MPSCVLRATGATSKVRKFLADSSFQPSKVFYRGDPGFPKSRGPVQSSGFNISISEPCGESIEKQVRQAISFLKKNRPELERMSAIGFKSICIDFGLYDLASEEVPWRSYPISKHLVTAAGALGFEIVLSFYGPS